jgi:hypothetical protein
VAEARPELPQHGVVRLVADASQRVSGQDHAITGVDRVHDGGRTSVSPPEMINASAPGRSSIRRKAGSLNGE